MSREVLLGFLYWVVVIVPLGALELWLVWFSRRGGCPKTAGKMALTRGTGRVRDTALCCAVLCCTTAVSDCGAIRLH